MLLMVGLGLFTLKLSKSRRFSLFLLLKIYIEAGIRELRLFNIFFYFPDGINVSKNILLVSQVILVIPLLCTSLNFTFKSKCWVLSGSDCSQVGLYFSFQSLPLT